MGLEFRESPAFNLQVIQRFPIGGDARPSGGRLCARCEILWGLFTHRDITELEKALTGVRYQHEDIWAAASVKADEIFDGVGIDDLVKFLY